MMRMMLVASMALVFALPALGKTYKSTYPTPCSKVWSAVTDTLSNGDNYDVQEKDDGKMTASYNVKHAAHVTVTGAILQRTNKVALVPKGESCEMHVVSNFSGWEHSDREDFKKRVDEALGKLNNAPPTPQAAEPATPGK